MRLMVGIAAGLLACACASGPSAGGPRPPQGAGPGGTEFGFWDRDADAAVDADFRAYITRTYSVADVAKAKRTLEEDGFSCRDGNRPDARPVPQVECERLYSADDIVHTWTVEFWPSERAPRAHYSRIQRRDDLRDRDEKHK